jgi:hypothetical protein
MSTFATPARRSAAGSEAAVRRSTAQTQASRVFNETDMGVLVAEVEAELQALRGTS